MDLFSRKPVATGTFRVTGVSPLDGHGTLVRNGVPQQRVHVAGLLEVTGRPAQAAGYEGHFAMGARPTPGMVVPAEVHKFDPLKLQIQFSASRDDQQAAAALNDAPAQVVAQLVSAGADTHTAGESDALVIALNDPPAPDSIAAQVAAALGTPISVDGDTGGVRRAHHAQRVPPRGPTGRARHAWEPSSAWTDLTAEAT